MRTYILLFFLSISFFLQAQDITAYLDYQGYLQVFDRGFYYKAEFLPIKDYKIGGKAVAYIDNRNDFRIFSNGRPTTMLNAASFAYWTTDYLTAFKVGDVLYVYDEEEKKTLCYYNTLFTLNDSLLAFFDDSHSTFNIYYNGKTATLEDNFLSKPRSIKAGANVLAWVNQSGFFETFYHGTVTQLDNMAPISYEAGRDLMAWVDDYTRQFHLFYKGDTALVEPFPPDSFKVGFGIMAYVDQTGNFRAFHNGATERLLSSRPDFFSVKGNIIAYSWNGMFNVYYDGKVYNLQNHAPADFQIGNDGLAWIDDSGRLNLFQKGQTYTVSYEIINKYSLNGNVLKYETGTNSVTVFYNGKNY